MPDMIRVNLLPPEYRAAAGTPVGRFVAIIAGVVAVVGAGCWYAYTHFVQLQKVREVKALREEEASNKERQKDRSLLLQREIDEYQQRRRAIQAINRNRILWSRKLDQFFDIVASREAPYNAWLEELEIPTQMAANRRPGQLGAPTDGGEFKLNGFLAMQTPNEAPAQNSAFYRAITGDAESAGRSSEFFSDFVSISNPSIDTSMGSASTKKLSPPVTGAFRYELRLRPPAVDGAAKKNVPAAAPVAAAK
jgi:cell division protein FtsB